MWLAEIVFYLFFFSVKKTRLLIFLLRSHFIAIKLQINLFCK